MDVEPAIAVRWSLSDAFKPGLRAVANHWKPFLLIQLAAVGCVIAYYNSQRFQLVADVLQDWKVSGGIPLAFLAGALAGGFLPEVARILTRTAEGRGWKRWQKVLWTALVFGLVGVFVDLFYKLQAMIFGNGIDPATLAYKTAFDMFCFAPLFCIPFEVVSLQWPQKGYRLDALARGMDWPTYRENVLPALLPCWAFWIPVLVCVYTMPLNLQFVFAILAEAAWSIIVVFVAADVGDR